MLTFNSDLLEDLRFATVDGNDIFGCYYDLLSSLEDVPKRGNELQSFFIEPPTGHSAPIRSAQSHKKRVQDAWIALLKQPLSKQQRKQILRILVHTIVPWFNSPERLMDFLTDSYNEGGETTLLALAGVFHLMQEKNLDYPSFFLKLYSLLDDGVLHSKHRSRFFRLLDTFMASTHLPAVLVASFIKRLSRLALYAPPSGIVVVVPWIYNMFKRHPTCTFMMHRVPRCDEEREEFEAYGAEDPFDMDEKDPMETGAIDSCVWELVTLQSHYHPNVATLAKIISDQFTKDSYNLEDFLDYSYNSVSHASHVHLNTMLTAYSCLTLSSRETSKRFRWSSIRSPSTYCSPPKVKQTWAHCSQQPFHFRPLSRTTPPATLA